MSQQQAHALTFIVRKPFVRRVLDQAARSLGRHRFAADERLSGVPAAYVVAGREVFDLLLGNGYLILGVPYGAVEIVE